MSTHIRTPAETESRTETRPTDARDAGDEGPVTDAATAAESASVADTDAADGTDSSTDRCQRQFSATDTRRLRNLADEANESMPNPD